MMQWKKTMWAAGAVLAMTGAAWAQDKPFAGVELKMLGIGDTSVTRVAPIVGEFEQATGIKVHIDQLPYPGLIDKIIVDASSDSPT